MRPCRRTTAAMCGGFRQPNAPSGKSGGRKRRSLFAGALTLGFGLGVALFFSPGAPLPYKVCYPAAWLSLVLFGLRDRACVPVACALLLSAAGDAAGAAHDFLLQMFFFALAHVAYIRYFVREAEFSRRRIAAAAIAGSGLLLFLFTAIVPRVTSAVERTGVVLYGAVIAAMLLSRCSTADAAHRSSAARRCSSSSPMRRSHGTSSRHRSPTPPSASCPPTTPHSTSSH